MRRVPVLMTSRGTRVFRRRRSLMLPASRPFAEVTWLTSLPLLFGAEGSIASRCHQLFKAVAVGASDIQFGAVLQYQGVFAIEPGHRFPDAGDIDDRGTMNTNE